MDYTNHPCIASQNDHLISINSCLEIDLTGQVCSESAGINMMSGSDGQLDFVEAAYNFIPLTEPNLVYNSNQE